MTVAAHLGLAAADYDAAIRRYIPAYEEMIGTVVALLDASLPAAPLVVDLGAGTGALAGAILAGIPRARAHLIDIDPAMLEVAARRCPDATRAVATFDDPLPACDAVVASLALHHVPERAHKRDLYARIRAALRPGGALLVADITVHEAGAARDRIFAQWAAEMRAAGIADPGALFARWAAEDRYYPLAVELDLLAEAGFAAPECFWKHGPSTVFGAFG